MSGSEAQLVSCLVGEQCRNIEKSLFERGAPFHATNPTAVPVFSVPGEGELSETVRHGTLSDGGDPFHGFTYLFPSLLPRRPSGQYPVCNSRRPFGPSIPLTTAGDKPDGLSTATAAKGATPRAPRFQPWITRMHPNCGQPRGPPCARTAE